MPKDIHVEPEKFAAELINRLEEVQKEREAEEKLEERLKRVRAVSDPLISPASLALCLPCTTGSFQLLGWPIPCSTAVGIGGTGLLEAPVAPAASTVLFPHPWRVCELQCSLSVKSQPWHSSAHFCHHSGAVDALHHLLWYPGSPEFVSNPWVLCKRSSPSHRRFCVISVSPTNSNQMTDDVMFGDVCVCCQAISTTTKRVLPIIA